MPRVMLRATLAVGVLAYGALAAPRAEAKVGCEPLAQRLPHLEDLLPVAIAVTTPCGHFLVERSGAVVRSRLRGACAAS